jgi:hypothetical protein
MDETADRCERKVLNILVGILNGEPVKPMLIDVIFLDKTNSSSVQQAFISCCHILWPQKVEYEKVSLLITDQASYMLLAGKNLKGIFPNLNHVTCIAHALNRVCSSIQENLDFVNKFVSSMKKVFLNSKSKQELYKEVTGLRLPPVPVPTRWCTWLETANYYRENFTQMNKFVDQLKSEAKSKSIKKVKNIIQMNAFQDQLLEVGEYKFLTEVITKLQQQNLKMNSQLDLINEVKAKLSGFAKEKLEKSLFKNPDFKKFTENADFDHRLKNSYAPLVSVEVERSFSRYKNLLTDKRQRFLPEKLKINIIIQFNQFLKNL